MALIGCPECGHSVSTGALLCPSCGMSFREPSIPDLQTRQKVVGMACLAVGFLFLAIMLLAFVTTKMRTGHGWQEWEVPIFVVWVIAAVVAIGFGIYALRRAAHHPRWS